MAEQEPEEVGQKGGAAEGYVPAHPGMYYEPTVTAVTDIVVPATRIQWGPVFAGLLIALSVTLLWSGLGVALGFGVAGMGYWLVGFGSLGLFLGSMFAARTAKADVFPAIMHAVIIWSLVMLVDVIAFGSIGAAVVASMLAAAGGAAPATGVIAGFGWWFYGGFLILLAASILGGLAGISPAEHEEHPQQTS